MLDLLAGAASSHGESAAEHAEAFGIAPHGWVAIAMLVVVAIALRAGVPGLIGRILDDRIASIRSQLDEAAKLRAEAAQLRDEYLGKIAGAQKEAAELLASAQVQAEELVRKAEADSKALVARRTKMANDKIAAAEREAVEELRERAAIAAAAASRKLIAERHDAASDSKLADDVIASI